ncbi:hypothetical protein P5E67_04950 [Vibrio parahaemolyticus]|nr:hypothetical protein [Vibrio parahaemolyticus]
MIRAIDENGNIYGSRLIDGLDQVSQELTCQLQLFKRENPYNLEEGIDWGKELSKYDEPRITALIRDRIMSVNGVTGIDGDVLLTKKNRTLHVSAIVLTEYGITPFEEDING